MMVAKEKKFTFDEEVEETNFYMNATLKVISSTGRHIFRELATLKVPPLAVRDVLSGVMLLLGEEKVNWTTMKKWMRETAVRDKVLELAPDKVDKKILARAHTFVSQHADSFMFALIRKINADVAPFADWIQMVLRQAELAREIAARTECMNSTPSARWARAIKFARTQVANERAHTQRQSEAGEARARTLRLRRSSSSSRSYFDLFCDAETDVNESYIEDNDRNEIKNIGG
eukprot:900170_1